jgi:biopolymer transport protein ExbB
MHRTWCARRRAARAAAGMVLATFVLAVTGGADGGGREPAASPDPDLAAQARQLAGTALAWFRRTPPADRITWGGLAACAGLGLGVLLERTVALRRKRIIPDDFVTRFHDRLQDGKLDRGKALDFCELNPSPAARVALAAVRRWGRPVADLERAVGLAHRIEADRLRRNIGTLRRIAAMSPLLGLLGTLLAAGRSLAALNPSAPGAWGPALAEALAPLTFGVALAILALVAYDGLVGRVETINNTLDRLGSETVDAIAMATPPEPRGHEPRLPHHTGSGPIRTPHSIRVEIPDPVARPHDHAREDDFD